MSVLPLKADIRQRELHVRYVPKTEVGWIGSRPTPPEYGVDQVVPFDRLQNLIGQFPPV